MAGKRIYDDGCATAVAMDLVGERWALLVARELMLGPKRFAELRRSLPGISANTLTQRLEDLEAAGVLLRRDAPPPVSAQVYELTGWGYALEPVFQALGRWAVRAPGMPNGRPMSSASLILSMRTMFAPALAAGVSVEIELRFGAERHRVAVRDGALEAGRGEAKTPDAVLDGDPNAVAGWLHGGAPLAGLEASGALRITGDRTALAGFPALFPH